MSEEPDPGEPDEKKEDPQRAPVPVPGTPAAPPPSSVATTPAPAPERPKSAQELFEQARSKSGILQVQQGKPTVDKYFGSKLPPVCRQLGCYVTDDGKFFYCINPHCHKDKKRETKYNRRKKSVVYFFCPKCKSREIQLHLKLNSYECLDCAYNWKH